MNKKTTFLAAFFSFTLLLFVSCTVSHDSTTSTSKGDAFELTQVAHSTTSITISWPTENSGDYIVKVYGDEAMTNLRQQYTLTSNASGTLNFSVPFLDC